ncbi:MAG: cupin domain-containing protein [Acidobacteriota bacterium]|nr:cupin domain-containing protein [Acidobacteriota bacterium]
MSPVRASEDRYNFKRIIPNGTSAFKVSTRDCSGDFFAMEHHHTKKGGPPRHRHTVEYEWFYVIEGEYLVEVGGKPYSLMAGDSVLGPRNIPHAFASAGQGSGRLLITYAPTGRMEESFDARDKAPGGRSTFVDDAEQMRAYGMELTGPPLSVT